MQFQKFSNSLELLEKTNSRLEMMYQLAELYTLLDTDEVKIASYLLQGSLVPAYLSLEFQLSVKMVIRALALLYSEYATDTAQSSDLFGGVDDSASIEKVMKLYKFAGDIGTITYSIVENWRKNAKNIHNKESLEVGEVYDALVKIAKEAGVGSQDRKLQKLVELLKLSEPASAKFITRIVVGKLRLGFSVMTILDALSWAVVGSKDHRVSLELAYQKRADVGELAQFYLQLAKKEDHNQKLIEQKLTDKYEVVVGIPVIPALCQRLNTAKEIIEKMVCVIAEPKYDGLRVQIHYSKKGFDDGSCVRAFTRNLEEVTHMFPELSKIGEVLKVDACVLDSEAIGFDSNTEKLLPFQATITRKRKHDVGQASIKVPIRFFVFDVLYSGNSSLLDKKLRERKELLKDIISENRTIKITNYIVTSNSDELHQFHEKKLLEGLEGAVIKQTDSQYQSGRKGWSWVKIKESEGCSGKLKDTLDVVVMGYYFGRGKRSNFGVGAFLVGVLNDKEEIKTIAKIGTGLSDEQFRELKKRGDALAIQTQPKEYEVEKALFPDVWMKPELVVEVAADEITNSPNHSAKVALRFPRLIKFRDDKDWTNATRIKELKNF